MNRLPLSKTPVEVPVPTELVLLMDTLESSPITACNIREWTKRDTLLSKVYYYLQHGWPNQIPPDLRVLYSLKDELSTLSGCILRGSRVLVPPPGRRHVLMDFHEGHPGICRMKSFIRFYVW